VPEDVRDLLQNEDDADRRQESLNDAGRYELGDGARTKNTHHNLDEPGQEQGEQEGLKRAKLRRNDGRESGCRPTDTGV
jgi:hypothetical protein